MGLIADTSILIATERGKFDLDRFLSGLADVDFAMSAITASELLQGVERATPDRRPGRSAFVEGLLARFPVIPFDISAARVHATLSAELTVAGKPVGVNDLLIAATAVARGWQIATLDKRSFPNVPGLKLHPI